MKILIVDDNIKMRLLIRRMIEENIQSLESISECEDGLEAIEQYQKIKPDWVLMDIRLKELDGLSTTRRIMVMDPDAKIITITQYNDPIYQETSKNIGAYDHVLKENLIDLINILKTHNNITHLT